MAIDAEFAEHIRDLFAGLGPVAARRMFSGLGLFVEEDVMFAMISSAGTVYMKSDGSTDAAYVAAGSEPFTYTRKSGETQVRSLMSLPESALDDAEEALHWARLSLPAARAAAAQKRAAKARKARKKTS